MLGRLQDLAIKEAQLVAAHTNAIAREGVGYIASTAFQSLIYLKEKPRIKFVYDETGRKLASLDCACLTISNSQQHSSLVAPSSQPTTYRPREEEPIWKLSMVLH